MKHSTIASLAAIGLSLLAFNTRADDAHHLKESPDATTSALSSGEVRKIDKTTGKITLKHGPLTNLAMPAMTMVFRVADPALLDKVKVGDKVGFHAEKRDGTLTVTQIDLAQ